MKEMVYSTEAKREVLDSGYCLGFFYYIINLGFFPTAYIRIPESHIVYGKHYDDIEINVHGGLTYSKDHLYVENEQRIEGWFIGWDYGHCGDYAGYYERMGIVSDEKKWTTEEIKREVTEACYQLNCLEGKEVSYE